MPSLSRRRGARVTGVDFSQVSQAKARRLAERCGVQVDRVEADATDLPASLHERFDLVSWSRLIGLGKTQRRAGGRHARAGGRKLGRKLPGRVDWAGSSLPYLNARSGGFVAD
jgi:hypothetical protein